MPLTLRNFVIERTADREKIFWLFSSIFLFAAYLTHLGYIPLDIETDEARRALVSIEMITRSDYLTPTLNGELFLNKPPLYNWIIIAYFKLFGNYSMFAFRLPVIVSLACMTYSAYYFTKKYTNQYIAFFTAFAFATNGRIFVYDSLQGLIDTTFSCIVYLNFMAIFWFGEKKEYGRLFLISYLLTALGFLTKGMPMLVFQSLSLATYFFINKDFRRLFSLKHVSAITILVMVLGTYYVAYFANNNISPASLFGNLLNESTKRASLHNGLLKAVTHFITFPLGFLYHFAPWTIFAVALFQKSVLKNIRQNRFIHYSACVFIVNIVVYWVSPEVVPRYFFMFLPLFFSVIFYLYFMHCMDKWQTNVIRWFVIFICVGLLVAGAIFPFTNYSEAISYAGAKTAVLLSLLLFTLYIAVKHKGGSLHALVITLIVVRVGFNLFVVEQRGARYQRAEATAYTIADITAEQKLYMLKDATLGNFDGMSFYLTDKRKEVLTVNEKIDNSAFYISDLKQLQNKQYTTFLQFSNYLADTLRLVKFR
jgi:4-amino-4-deoxy-L-arabinose transferase-like glycosyltransferase